MPGLTPGRRWQPAYLPTTRPPLGERALARVERLVKGALFGCRMCGNCLLQETAFICPMECPKGLRNGPCGGSTPERCYVEPTRPCIWYRIYQRAERMGRLQKLMEVLPPLDWSRVGAETWLDAWRALRRRGAGRTLGELLRKRSRQDAWEEWFRSIRQPAWWQGDDRPHPPLHPQPVSKLQEKLAAGEFVVTAEIAPPLAGDAEEVVKNLHLLRRSIDAANFTDNPSATARMSSLACAAVAVQHGVEPVMQIAARDRTRSGLQAEVMGASALGIRNVLCLTGDHPRLGPAPAGRMDIWDLDSVQVAWLLRRMRDDGVLLDGRKLRHPPPLFIGAAASPHAADPAIQAQRELKKFHAGVQFFQSNLVYDLDHFERYLEAWDRAGLLGKAHLLAGVTPVRSARAARIMNEVPGVRIPEALVRRLENSRDPREEGVQIALETIARLRGLRGVSGIHIMAVGWELIVPRLVSEAGLKESAAGAPAERPPEVGGGEAWDLPPLPFANRRYLDALAERVLVFDGAYGTALQRMKLTSADFGGERLAGCNDWLAVQKPEVIRAVHDSFLKAGCDVVETATFRANRITMAEYGLAERVGEMNRAAARLARACADAQAVVDGRPRFVAGALGPSGKLPSSSDPQLSDVSFAELTDVYREQALGLIDGGCDLLLAETMQDMLETKAVIVGAQRAFAETGQRLPLQVQVTLDTNGRMLLGTDIGAALATLERMGVDVLGINCSTGPEHMHAALGYLGEHSSLPLSCMPNAGLPQNVGGEAVYPLAPEPFAAAMAGFVRDYRLAAVGGCCGTTTDHIRVLARRVAGLKPAPRRAAPEAMVSSAMGAVALRQDPAPMLIGERLNAQGSKKMKELLLAEDYAGIVAVAREQVAGGAHTLDISCAMTERRDEAVQMGRVVRALSQAVEAPLVIDTTEADVLEAALRAAPGRIIVNAINMENGRQRIDAMMPRIRLFGAAVIALTIDEQGMARTADRKLEVAEKIYRIAVDEYGLAPDALIFDALTFTLATGDPALARTAVETLEGIRRIKAALPGVLTSLGVSNVSYGFKPAARAVLNSVFLHHAVAAGLDMAIVNPKQIIAYADIPASQRELADDLLLDRRPDATARFIAHFEGVKARESAAAADDGSSLPLAERIRWRILQRKAKGIGEDLEQLLRERLGVTSPPGPGPETNAAALAILNEVLLPAMKEVGDRFASGELILPFVLQSAEAMKEAVTCLERYLERADSAAKGRVVMATVYGDVHDIGKNLVRTILANNGYAVDDLGKQVPVATIVDRAAEVNADAIGLSALLVSTSRQMPLVVQELQRRGLAIPVLVGGAAINRQYGRDVARLPDGGAYAGGVFYCRDAFDGLQCMDQLCDPAARAGFVAAALADVETPAAPPAPQPAPAAPAPAHAGRPEVPRPPFWGPSKIASLPLADLLAGIDRNALYRVSWGGGGKAGPEWQALHAEFEERLGRMAAQAAHERWFAPQALYGYWPVQADGDELVVFDPAAPGRELLRFACPRQAGGARLCLADWFAPAAAGVRDVVALQLVTVGRSASKVFESLDEHNQYTEAYYFHGLASQLAEAAAAWTHRRIRRELGLEETRGLRFAWGYPGLPDVGEHRKLFTLLPAEGELGMSLTVAGQLIPEHSTAALVVHHPAARYFGAR